MNPRRSVVVARTLTVDETFTLQGLGRIYADIELASGISNPVDEASYSRTYITLDTDIDYAPIGIHGLTEHPDGLHWLTAWAFYGTTHIYKINKSTGVKSTMASLPAGYNAFGGCVHNNGYLYVLANDTNRDNRLFVLRYNITTPAGWTELFEYTHDSESIYWWPTIGWNEEFNQLCIARCRLSDGKPNIRTYDSTGFMLNSRTMDEGIADSLTSVRVTQDSWGAYHYVLTALEHNRVRVYTLAGTTDTTKRWRRSGSEEWHGMSWDGTRFWHIDAKGVIHRYETHAVDTSRDISYTWYDGEGTTHETMAAPRRTVVQEARACITIEGALPPDASNTDPAQTDKADRIGVYMGPVGGTLRLQGTHLPVGQRSLQVAAMETVTQAAPTSNGFDAVPGINGVLESTKADLGGKLISLSGNGEGRVGPYRWDTNGNQIDGDPTYDTGWVAWGSKGGDAAFPNTSATTINRCDYRRIGKIVHVRFEMTLGAAQFERMREIQADVAGARVDVPQGAVVEVKVPEVDGAWGVDLVWPQAAV